MASPAREERLADIAEWYYVDRLTQQQIADRTKITRSTISRMLAEAHDRGIVSFNVNRPLNLDAGRAERLTTTYPQLRRAIVVATPSQPARLHRQLGRAGAALLQEEIRDGATIGITWGRSLAATADALDPKKHRGVRVVQLAGAVAAESGAAHTIMAKIARRFDAETISLNAPLVVSSAEMANLLLQDPSNEEAFAAAADASVALFGIGTTRDPDATLITGGHLSLSDMAALARAGGIGDVGGHPIDAQGRQVTSDHAQRLVLIPRPLLLAIPARIGVAGGSAKAPAIRGAIAGGFLTHLATDASAADQLLAETA